MGSDAGILVDGGHDGGGGVFANSLLVPFFSP